jgi:hypothetical protein
LTCPTETDTDQLSANTARDAIKGITASTASKTVL